MLWLASFIMRRPSNAVLVASVFAVLAVVIAPFHLLSGATVCLVALRLGLGEGVKVLLGASIVLAVITFVANGGAVSGLMGLALIAMAVTLLPLLLLSWVLRQTRSMPVTVVVAGGLAAAVVVAMYWLLGDTTQWWRQALEQPFILAQGETGLLLSAEEINRFLDVLARAMTGLLGAAVFMSLMGSILLARWWQALLYNPGGFRAEFYALRIDYRVSILVLLVLGVMIAAKGIVGQLATDLLVVMLAMYTLVGIALIHGLVALTSAPVAVLFGLYLLLAFLLPQMMIFLAAAGYTDSWIDLRKRVRARKGLTQRKRDEDDSEDDL